MENQIKTPDMIAGEVMPLPKISVPSFEQRLKSLEGSLLSGLVDPSLAALDKHELAEGHILAVSPATGRIALKQAA